jgi:hypothetical protein
MAGGSGKGERWDSITAQEYWREQGETPAEAASRPMPWWLRMGLPPPDPPRRLQRRATPDSPRDSSQPSRPEGKPRRLVRIGALRASEAQNAATAPRSAAAPGNPPP